MTFGVVVYFSFLFLRLAFVGIHINLEPTRPTGSIYVFGSRGRLRFFSFSSTGASSITFLVAQTPTLLAH